MHKQTNLANISNLNNASKGSNSNSEAKSISGISINLNGRDEVLSDKYLESRRLSNIPNNQKILQTQNTPQVAKPTMRFSEKLSQKVIEDNFNYHTEHTEM